MSIQTYQAPTNAVTNQEYTGRNVERLLYASDSHAWATYRQWQSAGYQVQKGQKGVKILFAKQREEDKNVNKKGPVVRAFTVFSAEQVSPIAEE